MMMANTLIIGQESSHILITIGLSFTLFNLLNNFFGQIDWWFLGESIRKKKINFRDFSRKKPTEIYDRWKWRNIIVSLIHSTISGLLIFYLTYDCFISPNDDIQLTNDHYYAKLQRLSICFSIGYFIYDTMLSLSKLGKYPDRIEIIIHHVITIIPLTVVIIPNYSETKTNPFQRFLPFCLFGLIIELSNIFIHIRSIGKISQFWSQYPNILNRLNSICAIVSIVLFRFYPLLKIWIDIYRNYYLKSEYIVTIWGIIAISLIMLAFMFISIVILWRIIQEDFLSLSNISDDCQSSTIQTEKSDTHPLTNNLKQIKKQQ